MVGPLTSTPVGGLPWVTANVGGVDLTVETDGIVTGLTQQPGGTAAVGVIDASDLRYIEAVSIGLCSADGSNVFMLQGSPFTGLNGALGLEFAGGTDWIATDSTLTVQGRIPAAAGDVIRLASDGNVLFAYVNDLLLASWLIADHTIEAWGFFTIGGGTTTEPQWADFELGTVCPSCCIFAPANDPEVQ